MKIANITDATSKKDGTVELTVTDPITSKQSQTRYLAIRGGISWPTPKAGAYFCIVGQEFVLPKIFEEDSAASEGNRVLLAEHESASLSLEGFYTKLIDMATMMGCRDFYATMPEEHWACGFLYDFTEFCRKKSGNVNLLDAYDKDNFLLGVSRVKQGLDSGRLVLPKDSIIFRQLEDLTRQDLEDQPEERFHAINGVRHAMASFHRFAPKYRKHNRRLMPRPPRWQCA